MTISVKDDADGNHHITLLILRVPLHRLQADTADVVHGGLASSDDRSQDKSLQETYRRIEEGVQDEADLAHYFDNYDG